MVNAIEAELERVRDWNGMEIDRSVLQSGLDKFKIG